MSNSDVTMLVTMGLYLVFMLLVGFWFSKKNETTSDFYLGGRHLGPLVTAMSAEASDMSSYLLMGLPGLAYLSGAADVGWTAIGLSIGTYLNWLFVAKRLRRYSADIGAITIPSFFRKRYKDERGVLMLIAALEIVIFFTPYTASGFAACGKLFGTLFGIDYHLAMIVSALVIISYTMTGGFLAASTTDFVQSIIMTLALIVILFFGLGQAGGLGAVIDNARSLPGYFSMNQTYDAATGTASPYGFITIVSTLAWGLGYFGMPHILLRFMAIEDENKLKLSRRVASIWAALSMLLAALIGMTGLGMSSVGALPVLEDSETVIVQIATLLSHSGLLFAIIAGIVLSGILASTMSTADSQLLAASSAMSEDILRGFFHVKISERAGMLLARITLVIIAILGVILAWDSNSSVFVIVSFAWAGFGASFGPVMLLALFWRRSTRQGAIAGMAAGGIMVFVWKFLVRPMGGAWNIYELLPAFLVAIVINVIVSLLTPQPEHSVLAAFDRQKEKK